MISLVDDQNHGAFRAGCGIDPILGALLYTDYLVHTATHNPTADFWVVTDDGGRPVAAVGRVDGRLTLSAGTSVDKGELLAFLDAVGCFHQVTTPAHILPAFGYPGQRIAGFAMAYPGGGFHGDYRRVTDQPGLRPLYDLVAASFPHWGGTWPRWYADTSHMIRHSLGFVAGIYENGQLASTAGVYAIGQHVGVIACVATAQPYRGRGYAGVLIRYLCDRLLEQGKTPTLQCKTPQLSRYYGEIGFQISGHWGRILMS